MRINEPLLSELQKITNEYIKLIEHDVEIRTNRKGKQTKEEIINEIKHQLSFMIWASIMTFFSYHIFFVGFQDLKDGFLEVAAGHCMPSLNGVNHSTDILGRVGTFLGFPVPKMVGALFTNSVCEIFRNSAGVIIGAITMDRGCLAVLTGAVAKIYFPVALKRAIASAVDVVFRCFEDPEYAAKVKADAEKRVIIEDRKFKARKRKGFSLEDDEEEEEEEEDDEDEDEDGEEEEEEDDEEEEEEEEEDEEEASAKEKEKKASANEKMRIASEKASAKASEKEKKASAKASEKEKKASAIANEKMRKANEKTRIASERASAKASEKERKASAIASEKMRKASEKLRKADERKQAAELKKSIKLAANAASKRKTQKVRINEVATNRQIRVLSINGQKSDPITKDQFDDNLRKLGVYDDYYGAMKKLNKNCQVGGTATQKGGAFGFGTALAIKAVIMVLFAGGTFYLNWDIFQIANANWTANRDSYLLKPGYETTLFVMNMFGLGPPCHARHGFLVAATKTVMTGMSLASIFGMATLVGNNTVNTLGGFADYASMIYTNLS